MGVDALMYVRVKDKSLTNKQIKQYAWRLSGAFYREPFWYHDDEGSLTLASEDDRNYFDLQEKEDEIILKVNLMGRYYGIGYERGDLPTLLSIMNFIEQMIPNSSIYYGGDCSDRLVLMTKEEKETLWKHFLLHGHEPYVERFSGIFKGFSLIPHCPTCDEDLISNGGGGNETFWFCYGCNRTATSNKETITWNNKNQI